jgi:hypothetical protein
LDHDEVVLTMFELTLFNRDVIKNTKSGPIMNYRLQIYNHFERNDFNLSVEKRIRLCYCMMFFAFEIKNDMTSSVKFYKLLDINYLQKNGPIPLQWVSSNFCLDFNSIEKFGS